MDIAIVKEFMTHRGTDSRIYVELYDGRKMARSRFNMMKNIGVDFIPSNLHVHHINKDTLDDSINNLELIENWKHTSKHVNPNGIDATELRKNNLLKYNNSIKAKERTKKWRSEHREHLNEYFRNYNKIHRDEILERRRKNYREKKGE